MSSRNGTCDIDGRHGVSERVHTPRSRIARLGAASAVTMVMALAAVSCGDGADDTESGAVAGTESSAVGDESSAGGGGDPVIGEQLSRSSGCAGCHGPDFDGGAGPEWIGLAGSEVTLVDGSTVVADTAYLTRAIADPSAELVADYNLRMPANSLSDEEIAHIVAFIETLADE
jgi:mono/diheme cytochrome c family protein